MIWSLAFEQPSPETRIALTRLSLALICLILLYCGPYGPFITEMGPYLSQAPNFVNASLALAFGSLKLAAMLACALVLLGAWVRPALVILAVSFTGVTFYASQLAPDPWSYNTHLNFFIGVLCFADPCRNLSLYRYLFRNEVVVTRRDSLERASFGLFLMQVYVGMIYFQAALSKLLYGGIAWFTTGETLSTYLAIQGSESARYFLSYPIAAQVITIATGAFEITFLPLLLFLGPRAWMPLTLGAILFHIGTYFALRISFWHLWCLFPALFLVRDPRSAGN